jgi:hypothetical protein
MLWTFTDLTAANKTTLDFFFFFFIDLWSVPAVKKFVEAV